jgi:hypothetical protein
MAIPTITPILYLDRGIEIIAGSLPSIMRSQVPTGFQMGVVHVVPGRKKASVFAVAIVDSTATPPTIQPFVSGARVARKKSRLTIEAYRSVVCGNVPTNVHGSGAREGRSHPLPSLARII